MTEAARSQRVRPARLSFAARPLLQDTKVTPKPTRGLLRRAGCGRGTRATWTRTAISSTGRLKDIINRAGEKISPAEIDRVLGDHPAVAEALAFAVPDETLGEDIAAAVVLREGASADEAELRAYVWMRLAAFKTPRRIVLLEEIPKGPTGKLQRTGLAQMLGLA